MGRVKIGWAGGGLAVIGIAIWVLVYANAPGALAGGANASPITGGPASSGPTVAQIAALTRQGVPPERASQAIEVQGEVARADLVSKIEGALGSDFGGAWFEPATAQLHVGVTSAASRQTAEAVAARAGLPMDVTATSVGSTWAQLVAAQQSWNRQLSGLFAREEVATSLAPQSNSVEVDLGSSVPVAEREALERQAAAADVNVAVAVAPTPHLRVRRQVSRCNKFEKNKAFCNKTIAGGVTIKSEEIDDERGVCTAGPAVIKQNLLAETTETYLLTAGHCIEDWGQVGGKWYAFNKEGAEKGENEIGEAVEFLTDAAGDKDDVGVIKVDKPGYWAVETLTPVVPAIAPWSALEPEPFSVTGQVKPVAGNTTCISGQTSGEHCGTIAKVNQKIGGLEELVEVTGTATEGGDSGAPWFSVEEVSAFLVEGTHVGENEATGNPIFEPLEFSFAELALKLELLTKAKETRAACPMPGMDCFKSETGKTFLKGEQVTKNVFTVAGGTVKCTGAVFKSGEILGTSVATVTVHPEYTGCTAFGQAATVSTVGCNYELSASSSTVGAVKILCEAGKEIVVIVTSAACTVKVGAQTPGTPAVGYTNEGAGAARSVLVTAKVEKITYTSSGGICGASGANGTYTGTISTKGYGNVALTEQHGIWVE